MTAPTLQILGPTILTADGVYFDFENPSREAITLNAIARGLANTCRFAGQCSRFYSVAEHSVWVSRIVPEQYAIEGLLHDAAEAFIVDMPKPLKEMLPDYKAVEARIERAVFGCFGFVDLPAEIKRADRIMLSTEQRILMRNRDRWKWTDGFEPLDIELQCLPPDTAYHQFITRAQELGITVDQRNIDDQECRMSLSLGNRQ